MDEPKKKSILLVDDDPDLLALLQRFLEHDGYRVRTALDGITALRLCEEELPCLVIADLMLPNMDGEAFISKLSEKWPKTAPPVVLLSASSILDEVGQRTGVRASISKPFDLEDIRELVSQYCSR